ncbi:MAG: hypothetical protein ACPGLY_18140, partial [Rubripirellula sp.]
NFFLEHPADLAEHTFSQFEPFFTRSPVLKIRTFLNLVAIQLTKRPLSDEGSSRTLGFLARKLPMNEFTET